MKELIRQLCNAPGAGGVSTASEVVKALVSEYADEVRIDALGNVIATCKCGKEHKTAKTCYISRHIGQIICFTCHGF